MGDSTIIDNMSSNIRSISTVIAVDLDDVIAQTNWTIAEWHNDRFGTSMTLDHFHYYHYWKNPMWGTPDETMLKVKEFYTHNIMQIPPVVESLNALQALRDAGFKLNVVTARHGTEYERTKVWIDNFYPDLFESVTCTGQFQMDEDGKELHVKISKAEICKKLGANLLIDDSLENALSCLGNEDWPMRVLLFGEYQWSRRHSTLEDPKDWMSFEERLQHENGREWWKEEVIHELPPEIQRARNWGEVVEWIRREGEVSI